MLAWSEVNPNQQIPSRSRPQIAMRKQVIGHDLFAAYAFTSSASIFPPLAR